MLFTSSCVRATVLCPGHVVLYDQITVTQDLTELPPLTAIQTKDEDRHRFISRPSLFLCTSCLRRFAPSACEETCFEQISCNTTHLVDFIFIL
mmetsp:Transcript_62725/g.152720  ORF Transcript_62725/g.152720 Transcript_62725/m.152720 type:complete len:93 (+) Transcript_62725:1567-1845(+)